MSVAAPRRLVVAACLGPALLAGCSDASSAAGGRTRPAAEDVSARGRVVSDTLSLGFPEGLLAFGERIVVQDARAALALHLFDATGMHVVATGREGGGPGEFLDPAALFPRPGRPRELWVYDAQSNRITGYEIDTFAAGSEPRPLADPIALDPAVMVESPRWLDGSRLVGLSTLLQEGEGRFSFYGADGKRIATAGAPPPGRADVPAFVRQQAYGGRIAAHPQQPRFVLAGLYAGRLEVFDGEGRRLREAEVPVPFAPDYRASDDGLNMLWGARFRFGYLDVVATGDRIFALFSGRVHRERPDDAHLGDVVHVFDWEGRLVRILRLGAGARRIAVGGDGRTLLVVADEPAPHVLAFSLDDSPAE